MTGRRWSEAEDRLIARLWGQRPPAAIAAHLPGRSAQSVVLRGRALHRGATPRQQAAAKKAAGRKRDWTPAEDGYLNVAVGFVPIAEIAAELGRSETAIRIRAKRRGLKWYVLNPGRQQDRGMTAHDVARLLGLRCSKRVTWWIEAGYLLADRHSVRVGPNRLWRIFPEDLEDFLRRYRWLYDPQRIRDRGWRTFVAGLPAERYVGVREAARLLPYTPGGINELIRRGDLEAYKHGPNWKIPLSAVRRFTPPPRHALTPAAREALRRRREALLRARRRRLHPDGEAAA